MAKQEKKQNSGLGGVGIALFGVGAVSFFPVSMILWVGEIGSVKQRNTDHISSALVEKIQEEHPEAVFSSECPNPFWERVAYTSENCSSTYLGDNTLVVNVEGFGNYCIHASMAPDDEQSWISEAGRVYQVDNIEKIM
ncbi:MAG: hypothetical protein ABIJ18_04305 [archaeon]